MATQVCDTLDPWHAGHWALTHSSYTETGEALSSVAGSGVKPLSWMQFPDFGKLVPLLEHILFLVRETTTAPRRLMPNLLALDSDESASVSAIES